MPAISKQVLFTLFNIKEKTIMSLFDSVISMAADKFGLGDKSGTLLSALLSMMTNQDSGGFSGFLNLFSKAGLGDLASSWVSSGANSPLSNEQLESALGSNTIGSIAEKVGLPAGTATSAMAWMVPQVIDKLTPDGVVPEEKDLLSKIGDFLSGWGGAAIGAAGAVAGLAGSAIGGTADAVGDVAGAGVDAGKKVVGAVGDTLGGASKMVGGALDDVTDGGGGLLKWLLPLILLGLLLALGWWFCGKAQAPAVTNTNANKANVAVNSNVNANVNTNVNAAPAGEKKLTEVVLPNGTKLQAFPGGIEDELVKFIQSDEYKNGTEETLKKKWFSFDDLNFVFSKTELTPESKRQLDNITAILKAFPDVKMKIGGYTDKKGKDEDNLKLSDSRAKAVKAALDKAGVGAQVPSAEGYGETQATVAETESDEARKVDRKTAVRLIKGDAKVTDASAKPADAKADANAKPAEAKPATAANTTATNTTAVNANAAKK
jgi:uncharacterized protein YidB (DUF937 family)/outer membrane protein OmpA-like peptidoglycan-associated protein